MHRSASTSKVADDRYSYPSSSPLKSQATLASSRALSSLETDNNELPMYEPLSEAAKKERERAKFAENAVHVIPFVLFLCAFILWFLSEPGTDFPMKGDSVAARIEGLTLEGDLDTQNSKPAPGIGRFGLHKSWGELFKEKNVSLDTNPCEDYTLHC